MTFCCALAAFFPNSEGSPPAGIVFVVVVGFQKLRRSLHFFDDAEEYLPKGRLGVCSNCTVRSFAVGGIVLVS